MGASGQHRSVDMNVSGRFFNDKQESGLYSPGHSISISAHHEILDVIARSVDHCSFGEPGALAFHTK